MNKYIFHVITVVEVTASNDDEAYELLLEDDEEACVTLDSTISGPIFTGTHEELMELAK